MKTKTKIPSPELYLGIIVTIANRHWRKFPPYIQDYYGLDDLVGEVTLQVVTSFVKYNKARGAPTTFVWRVADNHCKTILNYHMSQKRRGMLVPIEDLHNFSRPDIEIRRREAKSAMERVIQHSSDELRRAMAEFFDSRKFCFSSDMIGELRKLVTQHGATPEHFRVIFQMI